MPYQWAAAQVAGTFQFSAGLVKVTDTIGESSASIAVEARQSLARYPAAASSRRRASIARVTASSAVCPLAERWPILRPGRALSLP